jgi:hypothetical protein
MTTKTYDELIAGYYGVPTPRKASPRQPARALSLSRDDGECLAQRRAPQHANGDQGVVYAASSAVEPVAAPAPAPAPEEYIVCSPAEPTTASPVDEVLPPVTAAPPPPPPPPSPPAPEPPATAPPPTAAAASVEEDELARDMQAILSGQMVYDPAHGKTVPRDQAAPAAPAPSEAPPPPPAPAGNEQAIFDRIAESMTYANAYDLGTVELENRFADFDRLDDIAKRPPAPKPPQPPAPPAAPPVGAADFLDDLDELHAPAEEAHATSTDVHLGCGPGALSLGVRSFAEPMYDTGEHAEIADDLYPGQLHVGQSPGVAFSYGAIIAMAGDLYETPLDLIRADVQELTKLKELVDRSTRFYATRKADKALDVDNDTWDEATGGRYLRLAEDNYTHFAPDTLFGGLGVTHGNHRSEWETYHRQAIEEAQRLALLPENQNRSYIPASALVINAFADHFLTDAFASGHLINKDVVIAKFLAKFLSGSSPNSAARDFFARVAEKAFVGDVRQRFSVLETFEPRLLWWHPNIDTTNAFRKLLIEAIEQEPVKVANLAAKALHDRLNKEGFQVTNAAGDGEWHLNGDQFLNKDTKPIMRKAVEQSIANINDPSILQSNLNVQPYFERVWRYTPQMTPASQTKVKRLVEEYTDPTSTVLSDAAAEIITAQVKSMVRMLIKEHKLRRA